jgi:hypothetical protein
MGKVSLAQRGRPAGQLDYIAIGRHRIHKSPVKPATIAQSFKRAA